MVNYLVLISQWRARTTDLTREIDLPGKRTNVGMLKKKKQCFYVDHLSGQFTENMSAESNHCFLLQPKLHKIF